MGYEQHAVTRIQMQGWFRWLYALSHTRVALKELTPKGNRMQSHRVGLDFLGFHFALPCLSDSALT